MDDWRHVKHTSGECKHVEPGGLLGKLFASMSSRHTAHSIVDWGLDTCIISSTIEYTDYGELFTSGDDIFAPAALFRYDFFVADLGRLKFGRPIQPNEIRPMRPQYHSSR
jgi:hypothetical protein